MKRTKKSLRRLLNLGLAAVLVFQFITLIKTSGDAKASEVPHGPVKTVLVRFSGNPVDSSREESVSEQVSQLAQRQQWLEGAMQETYGYKKLVRTYSQLPVAAYLVDSEGEASLKENPNVLSVQDDEILQSEALAFQVTPPLLEGDYQTGFSDGSSDFTGDGFAVAVLDDGVDKTHPGLDAAVVSEACYGLNQDYLNVTAESACPGTAESSTATGSGVPCEVDCEHGTAVAGFVALEPTVGLVSGSDPVEASGIAKDAKLIAIQVNTKLTEKAGQLDTCGDLGDDEEVCYRPIMSLILAGMNRVLELHNASTLTEEIAAVNISIGSTSEFTDNETTCAGYNAAYSGMNTAAASLKDVNIATIVAAGNSGSVTANANKISPPACLSNTIAVSASTADDYMTSYSNAGVLTDLVAPGGEISESADHTDGGLFAASPGETTEEQYTVMQGTSFSAPIVSGAWAVIREKNPDASVDGILEGLQDNGVDVVEDRDDYTEVTHKRINLSETLVVASSLEEHVDVPVSSDNDSDNSSSDTEWIPGVPNAGSLKQRRAAFIMISALTVLLLLNGPVVARRLGRG